MAGMKVAMLYLDERMGTYYPEKREKLMVLSLGLSWV